jgi:hypothetical protein
VALYKQMRDEMVAWIDHTTANRRQRGSVAKQAIVKAMRLAQITSGFVGGVQQLDFETGELLDFEDPDSSCLSSRSTRSSILSSEKIDGTTEVALEHPQPTAADLEPVPSRDRAHG